MFFFIFSGEPFWILLMLAGSFVCACSYFLIAIWQREDLTTNLKWMWSFLLVGVPFLGLFTYALNGKEIEINDNPVL